MSNWLDIISLVFTIAAFGGVIYGVVYLSKQISQGVQSTKEKLKEQGLHISDKGVSIKTSGRLEREDYVDATSRGFVKVMESASYGTANNQSPLLTAPKLQHKTSSSSVSSDEKKKKSIFGRKKKDQ